MRYASPLLSSLLALAAVAGADQRDFGFQPLEIHKFENGTSRLAVTDINGDGLDDILFANNHVSRLEILVRKPDAGTGTDLPDLDEQFENKGLIVDQSLKALRVADLNGNGRQDIITFGTAIGLQIRYQQDDGSFADPERVFIKDNASVVTIQIGDLNGNGRQDILVCRRNQADRLERLTDQGFTEKPLARIQAPVGLDLGGNSPGEIALSVMAAITAARYDKSL